MGTLTATMGDLPRSDGFSSRAASLCKLCQRLRCLRQRRGRQQVAAVGEQRRTVVARPLLDVSHVCGASGCRRAPGSGFSCRQERLQAAQHLQQEAS